MKDELKQRLISSFNKKKIIDLRVKKIFTVRVYDLTAEYFLKERFKGI